VDAAGGAAGEAAAAVQDVVPGVLNGEDELFSALYFKGIPPFNGNCRHRVCSLPFLFLSRKVV
jgi:hypothetical protein